jgi:hypothetical protein
VGKKFVLDGIGAFLRQQSGGGVQIAAVARAWISWASGVTSRMATVHSSA